MALMSDPSPALPLSRSHAPAPPINRSRSQDMVRSDQAKVGAGRRTDERAGQDEGPGDGGTHHSIVRV